MTQTKTERYTARSRHDPVQSTLRLPHKVIPSVTTPTALVSPFVLLQYVINERDKVPAGFRILQNGTVERPDPASPPPTATENLEKDRAVAWHATGLLEATALEQVRSAIQAATFFDLPPRLLINYCKDDPPTGIWHVTLDGHTARIVVYDPRPKRSAELDILLRDVLALIG